MRSNEMSAENKEAETYQIIIPNELKDPKWRKCLQSQFASKQLILNGIVNIRKFISQDAQINTLIFDLFQTQIHKPLFKYGRKTLQRILGGSHSQIQLSILHEIIWIMTNLCSGKKSATDTMIQLGIINFCKQLFLLQNNAKIIAILMELIGNIAAEVSLSIKLSFLGDHKFYSFMKLKYFQFLTFKKFHQNSAWTLCNLFKDLQHCTDMQGIAGMEDVLLAYYPIIKQLLEVEEQQARVSLLNIFFYISKCGPFRMNQTFQIIEKYLEHPSERIRQAVIQTVGNYIVHSDEAVDYTLNNKMYIKVMFQTLKKSTSIKYRKQTAFIISNMFAGSIDQVIKLVEIPGLFQQFHNILIGEQEQQVLKEFMWSISNSFSTCSQKTFQFIFNSSIIQTLSQKLSKCQLEAPFKVYLFGIQYYLNRFQKNPNLDFNLFLRNLTFIEPALNFSLQKFQTSEITKNIGRYRQKILEIIRRGPITEQQMVNNYFQNCAI